MQLSSRYQQLPEYTFDRLRVLLGDSAPYTNRVIDMSMGEPNHEFPRFITDEILNSVQQFGKYPPRNGTRDLRNAITNWLQRRYKVELDPEKNIIATNGSREGLFNACVALCPDAQNGKHVRVLIPNPFYQVYAGAAVAANAIPKYINAIEETDYLPDFGALSKNDWDTISIVYLCSPSNPQGSIASLNFLKNLMNLAAEHDFVVFSDECYSEIYRELPPPSMLQTLSEEGIDTERMLVFNSLSKRSNLPGLRVGFMAGGPRIITQLKKYRSYSDPGIPIPVQNVATKLWADEDHVVQSRQRYRVKYQLSDQILGNLNGYSPPQGGFFLWIKVPDGEKVTLELWQNKGIKVIPGAYFSRVVNGINPGTEFIRVALVADEPELKVGLQGLKEVLQ